MARRIDVHHHFIPPFFKEIVRRPGADRNGAPAIRPTRRNWRSR